MPDPYEAGKGRQRDLKGEDELQSYLEQAFGKSDVTSVKMRAALREWLDLGATLRAAQARLDLRTVADLGARRARVEGRVIADLTAHLAALEERTHA